MSLTISKLSLRSVILVALSLSFVGFVPAIMTASGATPDYTIVANPTSLGPLLAGSGATASSTVTVARVNNFNGTVIVSTLPSGLTTSLNLSSCTLSSSVTSCSGTLIVTAANIHGPFDVTVDAASGALDHTADVIVHVSDFSISSLPNVVGPQNPGDTGTSAIIVTAQDKFTGTVGFLLAPSSSHLTASILPTSLTFTSTGPTSQFTTLSVTFDTLGTYSVLVTGQSSGLPNHSTLVTVLSPPTVIVSPRLQPLALPGTTFVYDVSVVSMPPFAGYDIMVVSNPALLNPVSIDTSASVLNPGFATVNCVNGAGLNCGPGDGSGVAHSAFASTGFASADGLLFKVTYVTGSALDFSINASPNPVSVAAGATGTSTVKVTLNKAPTTALALTNDAIFDPSGFPITHFESNGIYGNTVTVALTLNHFSSTGLTAFWSTPSGLVGRVFFIFTGSATTASATLAVSASPAGTYSVDVSGVMRNAPTTSANGKIVNTATVTVIAS